MPNNDLISKSKLLERIEQSRKAHRAVRSRLTVGDMEQMIKSSQSVDAAPVRHGRWEAVENTGIEEWCAPPIRCSNCCKTMPDVGADFCPFCGQMNAEVQNDA